MERRTRRERGAAAVEFALVAPLLFALLVGVVEFGYAFNFKTQVNNTAAVAAREVSISATATPSAAGVASTLGLSSSQVKATTLTVDGATGDCTASTNSGKKFSMQLKVERATLTHFFGTKFTYVGKGFGRCP